MGTSRESSPSVGIEPNRGDSSQTTRHWQSSVGLTSVLYMPENSVTELAERLKSEHSIRGQTRYGTSRLDPHASVLFELARNGCKAAHLQRYLREKRVKVVLSTVYRWAEKNGLRIT